jgi:hypothetical protein
LFRAARNVAVQIPARIPVRVRLLTARESTPVDLSSVEDESVGERVPLGRSEVRSVGRVMLCKGEEKEVSDLELKGEKVRQLLGDMQIFQSAL